MIQPAMSTVNCFSVGVARFKFVYNLSSTALVCAAHFDVTECRLASGVRGGVGLGKGGWGKWREDSLIERGD